MFATYAIIGIIVAVVSLYLLTTGSSMPGRF